MTFNEWFTLNRFSKTQIARKLEVSRQTIAAWCKGTHGPRSFAQALRIKALSNGEVTLESWPDNYSEERQIALNFPPPETGQLPLFDPKDAAPTEA